MVGEGRPRLGVILRRRAKCWGKHILLQAYDDWVLSVRILLGLDLSIPAERKMAAA